MFDVLEAQRKGRRAMQKISTMRTSGKNIFQGRLTIGLDLGDCSSAYCVSNETGEIVFEHKLVTTPEAMKQVFGSMPRCRIAHGDGDTFSLSEPVVDRAGARSDRGARPEGELDRQEPSKR